MVFAWVEEGWLNGAREFEKNKIKKNEIKKRKVYNIKRKKCKTCHQNFSRYKNSKRFGGEVYVFFFYYIVIIKFSLLILLFLF